MTTIGSGWSNWEQTGVLTLRTCQLLCNVTVGDAKRINESTVPNETCDSIIRFAHNFNADFVDTRGPFISLRPRQNGRLFADDTFKRIFLNENIRISTKCSLKFVPKGLIINIPALVLIMAWRRPGDKPLSEPMLVRSLTHICVTRPQWVNWYGLTSTHCGLWRHSMGQHFRSKWLAAWQHQAIIWTTVDLSSKVFCGIHLKVILQVLKIVMCKISLKGFFYISLLHLCGTDSVFPAWIIIYIYYKHDKVWDEITYPFLNFNGGAV